MKNSQELVQTKCLNCGSSVKGKYCNECGQKTRDNTDRSIIPLLGEFLGNLFFIDNRFFKSILYLFRFPGRMTVEFLDGKRKKFLPPITLFLFFNLLYFLASPLSDYSLSLSEQFYAQLYSPWIQDSVAWKMKSLGLDGDSYGAIYQQMSDTISKSIMILNVPIVALITYTIAFKQRRFYFDSFIFALHFFTFFIFCPVLLTCFDFLVDSLPNGISKFIPDISFEIFCIALPILYGIFSIKKFLNIKWRWAIPAGFLVAFSVILANLIYRFLIFWLTLWFT